MYMNKFGNRSTAAVLFDFRSDI